MTEFTNNTVDFSVTSLSTIDAHYMNATLLVGYSKTTNDYFISQTPFALVVFEDCQFAVILIGLCDKTDFQLMIDQCDFMAYVG